MRKGTSGGGRCAALRRVGKHWTGQLLMLLLILAVLSACMDLTVAAGEAESGQAAATAAAAEEEGGSDPQAEPVPAGDRETGPGEADEPETGGTEQTGVEPGGGAAVTDGEDVTIGETAAAARTEAPAEESPAAAAAPEAASSAAETAAEAATEAPAAEGGGSPLGQLSDGQRQRAIAALTSSGRRMLRAAGNESDIPSYVTVTGEQYLGYGGAGYGDWHTVLLFVKDANGNEMTMFCMEPPLKGFETGDRIDRFSRVTNSTLIKIFYYGSYGPGRNYASEINSTPGADALITHVAAAKTFYEAGGGRTSSTGDIWTLGTSEKLIRDVNTYLRRLDSLPVPSGVSCFMTDGHTADGHAWRQVYGFITANGYVKIHKESEDPSMTADQGFSLAGARYGIYKDKAKEHRVGVLTTGEKGDTESLELYPGTYYVAEISAPEHFALNEEVREVKLEQGGSVTVKVKDTPVPPVSISTELRDGSGEQTACPAEDTELTDTVYLHDFGAYTGQTVTVKGVLVDTETGEPILVNGRQVEAAVEKKISGAEDRVVQTFHVNLSGLAGRTVTAFEYVMAGEQEIASHTDLKDPQQQIRLPSLETHASDSETGDAVGRSSGTVTIKDLVSYSNLKAGTEYTVKGSLHDRADGSPIQDKDGKPVTAETVFTAPEGGSGSVTLAFTFAVPADYPGKSVVAFEELHGPGDRLYAVHADLKDRDQTVYVPAIRTEAADSRTGTHTGAADGETVIRDTVACTNLIKGKEYFLAGMLMDKKTGEPVKDGLGREIRSELTFTAEAANCEKVLEFKTEGADLAGSTVVAFETLLYKDTEVAVHADLKDADQSVSYPSMKTEAVDEGTGDHVGAVSERTMIRDKVTCEGLVKGKEYTISGILMKQSDGEPLKDQDGGEITAELTFTAQAAREEQVLTFSLNTSLLQGETVVAFETLYQEDRQAAVHADLQDRAQSVYYPGVRTNASDRLTGSSVGALGKEVEIIDRVTCSNLIPGKKYTVSGTLMDRETGETLKDGEGRPYTAVQTFTAEEKNPVIELTFTVDSTALAGRSAVVFEDLLYQDVHVAAHADLTDRAQTIYYPAVTTQAADALTGSHTGMTAPEAAVEDEVTCSNLLKGETYTIRGLLMDKETGEALTDADGREITAEETFTAGKETEVITLTFRADTSSLGGKTAVAFQYLYLNGVQAACHADLSDEAQSVHYPAIRTHASVKGKKDAFAKGNLTVKDEVTYRNLIPGRTYQVKGILMDKTAGKALLAGGREITAETSFTPGQADGSVTLSFRFRADGLGGKSAVAFETLYEGDVEVAVHADLDDADQTVLLKQPPKGHIPPGPGTGDSAAAAAWAAAAALAGAVLLALQAKRKGFFRKKG